ncbi:hypothetical protein GCM10022276_06400 [Sphingomonas limnosediminicola]|uniref:Uncharacterized protein n=1 Tax=Sphingomonas limnosediminicola TaxID=940133 RepID=A0ABP7KWS3_9SPHN
MMCFAVTMWDDELTQLLPDRLGGRPSKYLLRYLIPSPDGAVLAHDYDSIERRLQNGSQAGYECIGWNLHAQGIGGRQDAVHHCLYSLAKPLMSTLQPAGVSA